MIIKFWSNITTCIYFLPLLVCVSVDLHGSRAWLSITHRGDYKSGRFGLALAT